MEDTGLVLHYSRVRIYCQVEVHQVHQVHQVLQVLQVDLQDPRDHQDLLVPLVRTCPEELQGRRSIQAWGDHQVHNCNREGRDLRHHQAGRGLREDLVAGLLPSQQGEPDQVAVADSAGSGWSPPFEQASSGSGAAATDRERDLQNRAE